MLKTVILALTTIASNPAASEPAGCDLDLRDRPRPGVVRELEQTASGHRLELEAENHPDITAHANGKLLVDGVPRDLDPETRTRVADYVNTHVRLRDQAADLGIEAAELGAGAAGRALAAVLMGTTDALERNLERESDRIGKKAGLLCETLGRMHALETRLAAEIPELKAYTGRLPGNRLTI